MVLFIGGSFCTYTYYNSMPANLWLEYSDFEKAYERKMRRGIFFPFDANIE